LKLNEARQGKAIPLGSGFCYLEEPRLVGAFNSNSIERPLLLFPRQLLPLLHLLIFTCSSSLAHHLPYPVMQITEAIIALRLLVLPAAFTTGNPKIEGEIDE
jgi:hypothetical protein